MPLSMAQRVQVVWLGPKPSAEVLVHFRQRGLTLVFERPSSDGEFTFSRALVLKVSPLKPGAIERDLREYASIAVDHGLKVLAVADDHTGQNLISSALSRIHEDLDLTRRTAPRPYDLAEEIARHQPGPPDHKELEILGIGTELLSPTAKLLLRRAFWNCKSILIETLGGGYSATVFSVHAIFADSVVGPRPLPFFAKLDSRVKIADELQNYQVYAEHYIPFNARPNLDYSKCLLGHSLGIIVGNFVEKSESFWDVAVRGHAQPAIYSLFQETLRGWTLQAYQKGTTVISTVPFHVELAGVFDPKRVSGNRWLVAQDLGAQLSPTALIDLLGSIPPHPHRVAPIHGDLHSRNIRVRGTDAILIDFASTKNGPIVADPASLETDLVFSSPVGSGDDDAGWRTIVDRLYQPEYFEQAPPPADQPLQREWLWTCVRQIRLYAIAMQMCDSAAKWNSEYQLVLAFYLLRHSMFVASNPQEEFRRAYAYVTAEALIKRLTT